MKLEAVELRRIQISLVSPFETSFGTQLERDILILKAITDDGEGWGECVAGEEPDYSSEYVEAAEHVLVHHLVPPLLARTTLSAGDVAVALRRFHGHRMAKASIEMAVLDAELRARRESFAHHFGAVRTAVDCGVSVGIHRSLPELLATVGGSLDPGFRRGQRTVEPGRAGAPGATRAERARAA